MNWWLKKHEMNLKPIHPFGAIISQPEVIKFSATHNIDLGPSGSTFNELINAICGAINKIEVSK